MDNLDEIIEPKTQEVMVSPNTLIYGPYITPEQRVSLYSATEYEDFILSWAHLVLKKKHQKVLRVKKLAGPGDYGRDVVVIIDESSNWENYQCKHYDHALGPSDVWKEVGKLLYHAKEGRITLPISYYFVAPNGVGKTLSDLLDNPEEFKRLLLLNWNKKCSKSIEQGKIIILDSDLSQFIANVDFSIFDWLSPTEVLEQYKETDKFISRFGGGFPNRPRVQEPSEAEYDVRKLYIKRLLEAYSDYLGKEISKLAELSTYPELNNHLHRQVRYFFSTEVLKAFVRDNMGSSANDLEDEVYDGIIDELEESTDNGYANVNVAIKTAAQLPLHGNALRDAIHTAEKKGACHHLAQADRVKWSKVKP